MLLKTISGVVAAALLIAFLAPPVIKLLEVPLMAVIAIGVAMMLVDFVQSLKSRDD